MQTHATHDRHRRRFASATLSVALLCLLCLSALTGCDDASSSTPAVGSVGPITEIAFGVISTDSTTDLKRGFDPFIADMNKAMGMPVKAYFAADYAGIIEGMRFGKVHLSWFGNKSAIEAVDRAGGEVFCQTVALNGAPGYWSLLITRKDAKYKTVDDIIAHGSELTFGNGDVNSTSGYLIPSYYLWAKHGIVPDHHFKSVVVANHQTNLIAVANGQIDFATNNTENLATFTEQDPDLAKQIHIVWKSPIIPLDPLVWRKDLPPEIKKRIKEFFMSYGRGDTPEAKRQREVLAGMSSGWAPFKDSSNAQLLPVREIMLAKQIMTLENDASMAKEAKDAKLGELQPKLDGIRKERQAYEATQVQTSSASP